MSTNDAIPTMIDGIYVSDHHICRLLHLAHRAPHSGIIPGSDTKLPFLCPADHVLDLEV
jgi:hypothetical protein